MTGLAPPAAPTTAVKDDTPPPRRSIRLIALVCAVGLLATASFASLFVGSRGLEPGVVLDALFRPDGSPEHVVIQSLRIPRTVLGVLVGAALGVGGALIQAFTRNPLADPGILGVNAGAGFAIVLGSAAFGLTSVALSLPFAFLGAILTTLAVYGIARRGGGGATPLRLTLVGIALAAVLGGISSTLALMDPDTFDRMRYWGAGTLANRPDGTIVAVTPFIVVGLVIALLLARSLNAFALGDELAQSLGARLNRVRILTIVAVTLLCGAATAAAGPIAFIGLMVPHAVRWLTGPDQRWILPFSMVLAPVLLLASDMIGRLVVYPGELQVGIVVAFLGAPVLMYLVRRTRGSAL
jgi:iron complex transport system permease protein